MLKCRQCEYWDRKQGELGACSVYPPALILVSGAVKGFKPETHGDDGCSLGAPKREQDESEPEVSPNA